MVIKIKVERPKKLRVKIQQREKKPDAKVELAIRSTLDGNYLVTDHEDIDIVLVPEKRRVLALAKDKPNDRVYATQDRLFDFLSKKGVVDPSTVQGGNIYGSMQAAIPAVKDESINDTEALLLSLTKFIEEEEPYFRYADKMEKMEDDFLLSPDPERSTELGEVPHSDTKGSMHTGVRPYGFMYNYSLIRENESDE